MPRVRQVKGRYIGSRKIISQPGELRTLNRTIAKERKYKKFLLKQNSRFHEMASLPENAGNYKKASTLRSLLRDVEGGMMWNAEKLGTTLGDRDILTKSYLPRTEHLSKLNPYRKIGLATKGRRRIAGALAAGAVGAGVWAYKRRKKKQKGKKKK